MTSRQLADTLLRQHDLLALPATAFGARRDHLALRLSVCDYDGGAALAACSEHDPRALVGEFAPRVTAAADAIGAFVEQTVTG